MKIDSQQERMFTSSIRKLSVLCKGNVDLLGTLGFCLRLPVVASLNVPLIVFPAVEGFVVAQCARKLRFSRSYSPVSPRKQMLLVLLLSWADYTAILAIVELLDLVPFASAALYRTVDPSLYWDRDDLCPALVL